VLTLTTLYWAIAIIALALIPLGFAPLERLTRVVPSRLDPFGMSVRLVMAPLTVQPARHCPRGCVRQGRHQHGHHEVAQPPLGLLPLRLGGQATGRQGDDQVREQDLDLAPDAEECARGP